MHRREQDLHQATARLLDVILAPPVEWTTIGHGGGGGLRGAILKGMGVKPGWPDIVVTMPPRLIIGGSLVARSYLSHNVGIELKVGTAKLSADQEDVHRQLKAAGWRMFTCRTLNQVSDALIEAGVPVRNHTVGPGEIGPFTIHTEG